MRASILTFVLVTSILFISYAFPTDNEFDKITFSNPVQTAVADAGPDTTLTCVVGIVTLEGMNTSMGPEFIYEWTDENGNVIGTTPDVEVFEPGEFILSVTNTETSFEDMDTTIVTLNDEVLEFSIIDPENLSCTLSDVLIDLVLDDPNANAAFLWEGPGIGPSTQEDIVATQAGIYIVTVSNPENGCISEGQVIVLVNDSAPIVTTQVQQELTCDQTAVVLESSTDAPGATYEWTNDAGMLISSAPNPQVTEPGTYTLTVTNPENGCSSEAAVEVVSDQVEETINVPAITTSETSIDLNATAFIDLSLSPWEFLWDDQNASFTPTINVNQSGTYTCIATNEVNGCPTTIIFTVNFVTVLVADAGPDQAINCAVSNAILGGPNTTTGPNISYIWTDEFGNQISGALQPEVFQGSQYTLTVNDVSTGEMAVDIVIVTEDTEAPDLTIAPAPTITCLAPTVTLIATSSNVDAASANYVWESFEGGILSDPNQASIIVDQGGEYFVTLTNTSNQCISQESVSVDVIQENQTEIVPTISSTTPTYTIDPSNFITNPNCTFTWTMQAGLTVTNFPLAEISEAGTYTFVKTDPATGCTTSYVYTIQFSSGTVADAGPDVEITCNDAVVSIGLGNSSVGPEFSYQWTNSNGDVIGNTLIIEVNTPDIYTLTVFNTSDNTFVTDMVVVLIDGAVPTISIPIPDVLDCNNTVVTLQGFSSIGSNVTFEWSTNIGNIITSADQPNIDVDAPGVYELTLTNLLNGCSAVLAVEVLENIDGGSFDIDPIQSSTYPITIVADDFPNNLNLDLAWTASTGLSQIDDTTAEIAQPGQYTFVATNLATGCDYNYIYTVYDNVLADAGATQSLTCVLGSVTLGGSNSSTGASIEYEWQNATGDQIANSPTVDVFEPGLYTLIVTDIITNETMQDQVLVSADFAEPIFTIASPAPLTFENPLTLLDATLFLPTAESASFEWTSSDNTIIATTEDIEVDISGSYILTVTNTTNGCIASSSTEVVQNFDSETIPLEFIVSSTFPITLDPTEIVEDTSGIMHIPFPLERSSDFEFKWIEREGLEVTDFPLAEVSQAGLYAFLRREISTGFVTRYEYDIESGANTPVADAGEIEITCITPMSYTLGGPNTSCGPEFTYEWTDTNGLVISTEKNPIVTTLEAYRLTVTNINTGEQSTDFAVFIDNRDIPSVDVFQNGDLDCNTDTISLQAITDSPIDEVSFFWTGPDGGIISDPSLPSININSPGVYEVLVTKLSNGCNTSVFISVEELNTNPVITGFLSVITSCESSVLVDPCTINPNTSMFSCNGFWDVQPGLTTDTFPVAVIDSSGLYIFNFTSDINGCEVLTGQLAVDVAISDPLFVEFVINADNQLEAVVTGGTEGYTYDWNVGGNTSTIENPIDGTEYILTVTDANGCALTESYIFVLDAVFTPEAKEISVSPNPTDGILHLDLDAQSIRQVTQLQIFDAKGVAMSLEKESHSSSRISLDLSELQAGMYILHAVIGGELYYQKVIVQ